MCYMKLHKIAGSFNDKCKMTYFSIICIMSKGTQARLRIPKRKVLHGNEKIFNFLFICMQSILLMLVSG